MSACSVETYSVLGVGTQAWEAAVFSTAGASSGAASEMPDSALGFLQ